MSDDARDVPPALGTASTSAPAEPSASRSRLRTLATRVGVFLSVVAAFLSGTVLEPVVTRYVPRITDVIDVPLGNAPLVVSERWPVSGGCDPDTMVAVPPGGPAPSSLAQALSLEEDPRVTAVNQGAASWNTAVLQVSLRARDDRTIDIDTISPVLLRRTTEETPAWVLRLDEGGCGGGPGAVSVPPYILDLERGPIVESGGRPVTTRTDGLPIANFRGATITTEAPLDIAVAVRSCAAFYQWQLVVDYSSSGLTERRVIGPFTSTRARTGVPVYSVQPGTASPGRTLAREPAPTDAPCP